MNIDSIEENHWVHQFDPLLFPNKVVDYHWNIWIDNELACAIAKIFDNEHFEIIIFHQGDDINKNESKWQEILEDLVQKKYKTYDDILNNIEKTLKTKTKQKNN